MTAPDYAAMTDAEINRLCAERVGWTESELPPLSVMLRRATELGREDHFQVYLRDIVGRNGLGLNSLIRVASPRQHCVAFLKATEGVK